MKSFDAKTNKKFADAAQSLKLYRRAELRDESTAEPLIEKLYVDPLQHDSVLETMLRPNTTFIVGRKGTGKSTVFQRAQHEIRKQRRALSAYVDIKTVYESAEIDPSLAEKLSRFEESLSPEAIQKLLLYRAFTRAVFIEIQRELDKQINSSVIERVKEAIAARRNEVIEALNDLLEGAFEPEVADISAIKQRTIKTLSAAKQAFKTESGFAVSGKADLNTANAGAEYKSDKSKAIENDRSEEFQYSDLLLRTFNINAIMERLGQILSTIGVGHLYIFIDDFSELPREAMVVFVDAVLAPLNNWSDELIKFKVAAYPGRLYYGKIDKTKSDEIYLDTYRLYGGSDVSSMEEKAIDFTRRLINNRTQFFLEADFADFCESNTEEIYRQLFFATMGNARILGHLLHYLREDHLVYGKKIGLRAIQEVSARYYDEKIEPYFGIQKFSHETFEERSSIFSLKELLEQIVERARELKTYKESAVTRDIHGRTPSSHFHILSELDSLLSTLELNFFLTKYYEMKDRDGRKVSVYALNFGLCAKYSIAYGRPEGKREFRLYYVERIFDYTSILKNYLRSNQEIKCESCGAVHGLDKLDGIKMFDMMCPTCKKGRCVVTNLSRKYESVLRQVGSEMLLPPTELGILATLYVENRELAASEIAEELDCSYQLVGKRGKIMEERGLVARKLNEKSRRLFSITKSAATEYFESNADRRLDIPPEDVQ